MHHFLIAISVFIFLFIIERIINYSHTNSNRELLDCQSRVVKNILIGTIYRVLFIPLVIAPIALSVGKNTDIGLFNIDGAAVHFIVCLLAYDLTNYSTHVIVHKIDFLWRFHSIHHLDNQLDSSTGFRQHFAEKLLILPIKIFVIMLFAMTPTELVIFGTIGTINGIFHHSRIPIARGLENVLLKIFTIPSFHAVHHLDKRHMTDSNYGFIFTFWDRLFNTISVESIRDIENAKFGLGDKCKDTSLKNLIIKPFFNKPPF